MSYAMKRTLHMAYTLQKSKTAEGEEKKDLVDKFWNLAAEGIQDLEMDKPFVPETANDVLKMLEI